MKGKRSQTLIMGKNCIAELAAAEPERIIAVYTSKPQPWERDSLLSCLLANGIRVIRYDKQRLRALVQSDSHQSYVAEVVPRERMSLKTFIELVRERERTCVLVLDSIMDPQNVGALLRAAECFGVDAVLWSKNRGAAMTPVVAKASVGASELVNVIQVSNLVESCRRLKDAGYWIVTAEVGTESVSLPAFAFPERTLLVVGSEGEGIQPLLSKEADMRVYIPMNGRIDSLNVSQATAVLLARWALPLTSKVKGERA